MERIGTNWNPTLTVKEVEREIEALFAELRMQHLKPEEGKKIAEQLKIKIDTQQSRAENYATLHEIHESLYPKHPLWEEQMILAQTKGQLTEAQRSRLAEINKILAAEEKAKESNETAA